MRIFHITFFTLAVLALLPHSLATEDTITSAKTLKHEVMPTWIDIFALRMKQTLHQ